ncbi:MAG: dTDP-4-dehydrorhamnose reductase [bacterium]|nr:dTDP-4-dehydrorhamnose reductase [bacterium]
MKILILGAKGMLGQELVNVYSDTDVHAWDREECDVTNVEACEAKIKELAPELIINAIAYNDVDGAEGDRQEIAKELNVAVPSRLAETAKSIGATFVHFSSEYVFDGKSEEGYTEDSHPSPVSVYGTTKMLSEQVALSSGARAYVIRLSRMFGKPASSEAGKKSFVDLMLELAKTKDHLDLVDEEYSSPTYAPDLAKRTREIVETQEPGLYHAANSGACTWYDFAKEIFAQKGINIDISPVSGMMFPRPAMRPMYGELLSTKMPAMRSWQTALKDYLENV